MRYIFKKGDVVKLIPYEDDKNKYKAIKSENKYNAIANFSPDYLIILRCIDEITYLVAVAYKEYRDSNLALKVDSGEIYIFIKSFFSINVNFIRKAECYLLDSYLSVQNIYSVHNTYKEEVKKKRKEKRAKERKKNRRNVVANESKWFKKASRCSNRNSNNSSKIYYPNAGWSMTHPVQGGRFSPR